MPYTKNSYQKQFKAKFGQPIESYATIKKATQTRKLSGKQQYYRELPLYFIYLNQTPDQVIEQRKTDLKNDSEFYEIQTEAFANYLIEKGIAGKTVSCQIGRVRGFFSNNHRRYALNMRGRLNQIPKARKNPKYSPSNEDVRLMLSFAENSRDRFILTFMYQCGPDPIDVVAINLDELPLVPWSYFERSRCKTGEIWRGIITPDISNALKSYLTVRSAIAADLKANGKTPTKRLLLGRQGPLGSSDVSTIIRSLIDDAGLGNIKGFKPTSLRDAFEDALVDAEIYRKIKEALMGHGVDIEQEYGGHKKMVDKITEAARKVYPFICLSDANKGLDAGVDLDKLNAFLELSDDLGEIVRAKREKRLLFLDDPDLQRKLKDAGIIKEKE